MEHQIQEIQIFDTDGHYLGKIGSPCKMSAGEGCIDPDGQGPLKKVMVNSQSLNMSPLTLKVMCM